MSWVTSSTVTATTATAMPNGRSTHHGTFCFCRSVAISYRKSKSVTAGRGRCFAFFPAFDFDLADTKSDSTSKIPSPQLCVVSDVALRGLMLMDVTRAHQSLEWLHKFKIRSNKLRSLANVFARWCSKPSHALVGDLLDGAWVSDHLGPRRNIVELAAVGLLVEEVATFLELVQGNLARQNGQRLRVG